jgi:hypothetical protein
LDLTQGRIDSAEHPDWIMAVRDEFDTAMDIEHRPEFASLFPLAQSEDHPQGEQSCPNLDDIIRAAEENIEHYDENGETEEAVEENRDTAAQRRQRPRAPARTSGGQTFAKFREELESQRRLDLVSRLRQNVIDGIVPIAYRAIMDVAIPLQCKRDVTKDFERWLFDADAPERPFPDDSLNPNMYWRSMHAKGDQSHELSMIALRFISLAASEAEVERTLSLQKNIQGLHGTNYGTETLHARLVLHKTMDTFRRGGQDVPDRTSSDDEDGF